MSDNQYNGNSFNEWMFVSMEISNDNDSYDFSVKGIINDEDETIKFDFKLNPNKKLGKIYHELIKDMKDYIAGPKNIEEAKQMIEQMMNDESSPEILEIAKILQKASDQAWAEYMWRTIV